MVVRLLSRRAALLAGGLAAAPALAGCGVIVRGGRDAFTGLVDAIPTHPGQHGGLSTQEQGWAAAGWAYFATNADPATGLSPDKRGYPVVSVWGMGDQLIAVLAAYELGLLDDRGLDQRLSQLLGFLGRMPLTEARLPSKAYHATQGAAVLLDGSPGDLGWSGVDLGRLLVALALVQARQPRFAGFARQIVDRFDVCAAVGADGRLESADRIDGRLVPGNETPRGYDAYAALGFGLWGIASTVPVEPASDYAILVEGEPFAQVEQPDQDRMPPVLTGPYVLAGVELGWHRPGGTEDEAWTRMAQQVRRVQAARHARTGILTARTEHLLSGEPYFLTDTVFARGYGFNSYQPDGRYRPDLALVSTRAAFGLWLLWRDAYGDRLIETVALLHEPEAGWYEGRFELNGGYDRTMTAATNAFILEGLLYKTQGQLYRGDVLSTDPGCSRL